MVLEFQPMGGKNLNPTLAYSGVPTEITLRGAFVEFYFLALIFVLFYGNNFYNNIILTFLFVN